MDESVINGANLFFPDQLGISQKNGTPAEINRNQWLLGLVNGAPYVSIVLSNPRACRGLCCGGRIVSAGRVLN